MKPEAIVEKYFNLEMLQLSLSDIKASCALSAGALEWDLYERDRRRLDFLTEIAQAKTTLENLADGWQVGRPLAECDLDTARALLSPVQQAHFDDIKPRRKRAIGQLTADWRDGKDQLAWSEGRDFAQESSDYYPAIRHLAPIGEALQRCKALAGVVHLTLAEISQHLGNDAFSTEIFVHHVRLFCSPHGLGEGAPEGIHQDGADYIIPALIVHRSNVSGFISQTYEADDGTLVPRNSVELDEGEWILQSDVGSPLYHDVSPGIRSRSGQIGIRETIGLDIHLRH